MRQYPDISKHYFLLVFVYDIFLYNFFRMEKVEWRNFSSEAKVLGTVVSISGAFVVILYKGPPIGMKVQFSTQLNWILGGICCVADSLFTSMWYIYQVRFNFTSCLIL